MNIISVVRNFERDKQEALNRYLFDENTSDYDTLQPIETWPTSNCIKILEGLARLNSITELTDDKISPWCYIYSCNMCPYGYRHGICRDNICSTYQVTVKRILNKRRSIDINYKYISEPVHPMGKFISSVPDMKDVIYRYSVFSQEILAGILKVETFFR